jgi:hypothetical protein
MFKTQVLAKVSCRMPVKKSVVKFFCSRPPQGFRLASSSTTLQARYVFVGEDRMYRKAVGLDTLFDFKYSACTCFTYRVWRASILGCCSTSGRC